MDDLTRLVAIEDIKQLKYRYFRFLDTHDWERFRTVWAPDAILDLRIPNRILNSEEGLYQGSENITEFAKRAIGEGETIDHAIMPEIEILTATTARAIWVQEDRLNWPPGYPNKSLHGHGYEHETYEKIADKWHIKSAKLVRIRADVIRSDAPSKDHVT